MSKAFTREENEGPEHLDLPERETVLPEGARNYLTAAGAKRMREELARLISEERPRLLDALPDPEVKRQLAKVNERIARLERSLETAEVLPSDPKNDRVHFGCTVTLREENGEKATYQIVGVDEADFEPEMISWASPLARALLHRQVGETVSVQTPGGAETLQILKVEAA